MDKGSNKLNQQPLPDTAEDGSLPRGNTSLQAAQERTVGVGSQLDDKMPQTCCSTCQTVFEVSPELLASSDTRVRCGECLSIFDALTNLRQDDVPDASDNLLDEDSNSLGSNEFLEQASASVIDEHISPDTVPNMPADNPQLAEHRDDPAELDLTHAGDLTQTEDLTYTEYDLFSGKAGLPDVAYFDQTQELDSLNFDEPDGDETFSDEIFAHDLTMGPTVAIRPSAAGDSTLDAMALDSNVDFVTDDVQRAPVVFNYQDRADEPAEHSQASLYPGTPDILQPAGISTTPAAASRTTMAQWLTRIMLALLLLVIAGGLYGFRSRHAIIQNPDMRPMLSAACSVIGCQLPPLVSLDQLKVLKRSVFSHPTLDNALVIDLAFVNQAAFSQGYPVLEIRLTNRSGGLVVQKNVEPANYLDNWQAGDLLSAGERLDLSLTVEDPGQTATSFELKFR